MFIGYFSLANTVTLLGLSSSIMAVFCASQGLYPLALIMFMFAGLCDMFDGRIARGTSGRIRREKIYGIQLDSLADLVSFGVVPALIVHKMGYNEVIDLILYLIFIVCGATRLAYFNTQALSDSPDLNMKTFTGLPIPFSCAALPVLVLFTTFVEPNITVWLFRAFFLLTSFAFILRIKIKKFSMNFLMAIGGFDVLCLILLSFFADNIKLPV
ncbi:MAG: hypothetical protein A2Y15_03500 [Clostridiales bacterium GWF2_36_10]|nr:MAG: hypothetical protein A2Y15_03500 [Clostridiales bacterium GWF2_36_10]HAN20800.1 hypothetical protein [Clostridiales bacterium]